MLRILIQAALELILLVESLAASRISPHVARATNTTPPNYTILQGFEWNQAGGATFLDAFANSCQNLSTIGITAAWLPPQTKASTNNDVGYGVYDIWDLGEFNQPGNNGAATKWGTRAQYLSAIQTAKSHGISVYVDAVLNHKTSADYSETFNVNTVNPTNRNQQTSGTFSIQGWTGFDYPRRNNQYSRFKWNHTHFTAVDYDSNQRKNGIYQVQGNHFATDVDTENGNYDFLLFADIDHAATHADVTNDLMAWSSWVLQTTGAVGFRFDAVKHISEGFLGNLITNVRRVMNNPNLFCVGEYWSGDVSKLTAYLDRFPTQISLFDAPLHYNFQHADQADHNYDLRNILQNSLVATRPISSVTFVDNHDTQPGQSLQSWISPTFKPLAYALILFRDSGYPCVFAGDLYGLAASSNSAQTPPMPKLANFVQVRKYFTYGATHDYFNSANTIGWVRDGDEGHDGCAVVLSNSGGGSQRMQLANGHTGEVWTDVLGNAPGQVTIGTDGFANFYCSANSVSVWTKTTARGRQNFTK